MASTSPQDPKVAPTAILGSGIIGLATAYYLSLADTASDSPSSPSSAASDIHLIDPAPDLFTSASSLAAGFIGRDNWFGSALAPLGVLSFRLHRELAEKHGGADKWGYASSQVLGLDVEREGLGPMRGDGHDWLLRGGSRADVVSAQMRANGNHGDDGWAEAPAWMTRQAGGRVETLAENCAQVDPYRLCKFLLAECLARGVQLHHPVHAVGLSSDEDGDAVSGLRLLNTETNATSILACSNVVLAAGAWTPTAFAALFPHAPKPVSHTLPVTPLAGYSLLLQSPRHTQADEDKHGGVCHALFTTHPSEAGFSPEIFSRRGAEVYIAGLNVGGAALPLPALPGDSKALLQTETGRACIAQTKRAAAMLMGKPAVGDGGGGDAATAHLRNEDDLTVLREGLCFRPRTPTGGPFVSRLSAKQLGGVTFAGGGSVFVATGHGPWGISLSLGTGLAVARMVRGEEVGIDVGGLSV